jgi:hypothetical protein
MNLPDIDKLEMSENSNQIDKFDVFQKPYVRFS